MSGRKRKHQEIAEKKKINIKSAKKEKKKLKNKEKMPPPKKYQKH